MKLQALTIAVLVLMTGEALAQEFSPLPFTKGPVSQERYARAIEENDQTILNASCDLMVASANQLFLKHNDNLRFASCAALASYVRLLNSVPCPQSMKTSLGRILADRSIDLYGYSRELREGELCVYDNQRGIYFASLSCGNFITGKLPVYTAMIQEEPVDLPEQNASPTPSTPSQFGLTTNVPAEQSVRESATEEAKKAGVSAAMTEEQITSSPLKNEPPKQKRSWLDKNKKWFVPVTAAALGATVVCILECDWRIKNVQETNIVVP